MSARALGPGSSVTMRGAASSAAAAREGVACMVVIGVTPERSGASCPRPWLSAPPSYQRARRAGTPRHAPRSALLDADGGADDPGTAVDHRRPQLDQVGAGRATLQAAGGDDDEPIA